MGDEADRDLENFPGDEYLDDLHNQPDPAGHLLDGIELLPKGDESAYEPLWDPDVMASTAKAILVNDVWVPKSVTRLDEEQGLWVRQWFVQQHPDLVDRL